MPRLQHLWPLGLLVGFVAALPLWSAKSSLAFLTGVYRYPPVAQPVPHSSIEAAFVSWVDPSAVQQIQQLLFRAERRRALPLLTLEPFADPAIANGERTLVRDVEQGRYKARLAAVLDQLCRRQQPVLLRFAHEMDHTGQYPWSLAKGADYVRLYRSVWAQAQQPRCRRLHWVWSPAGNGDPRAFWPGADAVDLIGVSVYSSPRWQSDGSLRSFAEIYDQRRWLHLHYRKPLLIAEMGVSGSGEQRRRWLREARSAVARYPELLGWVYFSAPQPRWIPLPTGHEDWTLPALALPLVVAPPELRSPACTFLDVSVPPFARQLCPPPQRLAS